MSKNKPDTTTLAEKLRDKLAFREPDDGGKTHPDYVDYMVGRRDEYNQYAPLHEKLIACVEALEQAIEVSSKYKSVGMDLFSLNGMLGSEVLSELEKELNE